MTKLEDEVKQIARDKSSFSKEDYGFVHYRNGSYYQVIARDDKDGDDATLLRMADETCTTVINAMSGRLSEENPRYIDQRVWDQVFKLNHMIKTNIFERCSNRSIERNAEMVNPSPGLLQRFVNRLLQ